MKKMVRLSLYWLGLCVIALAPALVEALYQVPPHPPGEFTWAGGWAITFGFIALLAAPFLLLGWIVVGVRAMSSHDVRPKCPKCREKMFQTFDYFWFCSGCMQFKGRLVPHLPVKEPHAGERWLG